MIPARLPRAVWTTSASGRAVQIWVFPDADDVEIDVSDLAPELAPELAMDKVALADLLRKRG